MNIQQIAANIAAKELAKAEAAKAFVVSKSEPHREMKRLVKKGFANSFGVTGKSLSRIRKAAKRNGINIHNIKR